MNYVSTHVPVFNVAWKIVQEGGLAALSRTSLADRLGIATGSVSYTVGSMDRVYEYVLERAYKDRVKLSYRIAP
jgi:AcrR family transcriptional regulator